MEAVTGEARLSKRALFETLKYAPHPGQLRVHQSRARHKVLVCGTRWGKSTCAGMETVAELLMPREKALGWLVAPTYDLTRRIFDRVVVAIQEHFASRVQEYRPREHTIVVTNLLGGTSVLRAKSADQPVGLLGEALDYLVVDEATQLPDHVWHEKLSPRLIDRNGSSFVISTPQSGGWFYEAYMRGKKGTDPECQSWRAPSWENTHLDRAAIEAERGKMPAEKFAQMYEAEFEGVPKEPCEKCGGPRPDVSGVIEVPEGGPNENDFLVQCPACGMFVDENGRCIVKFANPWFAYFEVHREWGDFCESCSYHWDSQHADGRWK